jgi:hypothetical protein
VPYSTWYPRILNLVSSGVNKKPVRDSCCTVWQAGDPPPGWKEDILMDRPWFDEQTGTLLLDDYAVEMDSYRRIVEDETITDAELLDQTQRVVSLLQQLEEVLSPEAKALATEALSELAVLSALQVKRLQAALAIPQ